MESRFVNPNQLRRLRKQDGITNHDDVFNLDNQEDIANLIDEIQINTKEIISTTELTRRQSELLKMIRSFINNINNTFKKEFVEEIKKYNKTHTPIPEKILSFLTRKNLLFPSFILADADNADSLLNELGLSNKNPFKKTTSFKDDEFLLVFQLPKPLARF